MLAIPFGLYHTVSEYHRRSPILLVCVTPELQWTHRYFPPGASLIFDRYFSLMNALHVDWLSRRHKFSSILASAGAARMVLPTCMILVSPFLTLLLISSVFWTSWVEVWNNMRLGDGSLLHYLVGYPIMRLHQSFLTFTNYFWSPPPGGLLDYFYLFIFLNASVSSFTVALVGQ